MATALALAERGERVVLFERDHPGMGSSWAGAGILYPLLPWDYPSDVLRWCLAGIRAYPGWVERLQRLSGVDVEYRVSGLRVVSTPAAHDDTPKATAWLDSHAQHWQAMPDGLLLPDVAQVRNPRLVEALRLACLERGVELRSQSPVESLQTNDHSVLALHTRDGVFACDALVVCAGAWSGELAGLPPRTVWPVRGQMLALQGKPDQCPIIYQGGKYIVPRADGVVLVGATLEDVGFDASTTASAASALLAWAHERRPDLVSAPTLRHWAGLRPGSAGNRPLVGRHPRWHNVWLNCGHYRYGVTMAPACASALAIDMLENPEAKHDAACRLAPSDE